MRSLPRQLRNFTILTFCIGLLFLLFNGMLLFSDPDRDVTRFGIIVLLFCCIALTRPLRLKRGDKYLAYRFWEYPIIVGLTLGPAYSVAVAFILVYGLLGIVVYARSRDDRTDIPVDFGTLAIAGTVGCAIGAMAPPVTYAVGTLTMIAVAEGFRFGHDLIKGDREYAMWALRSEWVKRAVIPIGLALTATAMTYTIGPQREFLLVLPASLLLLYWLIQWRMDAVEQHSAWKHMESISSKFIGELEEHKAITVALEESLNLFSARRSEIILPGNAAESGSRWSLQSGPGNGVEVEILPPNIHGIENMPETDRNSQVIPLTVSERNFGVMVIEWDPLAPEKKTRAGLTNTFGHAVAASIANTRHNKHISEQAANKAREAERDPLTGLGNRSMLSERGPALLSESSDIHRSCALLLFDLDGFKRINDTLGHAAGDKVLAEVARRINDTTRKNDLAIRLGGDEFAVLAVDMEMAADAERLASKITRALIPPIEVEDLLLSIESSIGVAIYPGDAQDIESLLKLADIAMYQAKAIGRGKTVRYSPAINFNTTESLFLATDLRRAIFSSEELVLHYQPQIDLRTNNVIGVEALVRWNHPRLGLLYPDRFVSIAERSNLIRPFTLAIIEKALAARVRMQETMPNATVSVNLSAQNLLDTGLSIDVQRMLEKHGVDPTELILEVTETTTAKDVIAADKVLNDLANLGCHIAMDDFGSGYATMESMRSGSPINEIKIDRGFIEHIVTNDRDCRVARAIIEIAHAWDCRVVAEGIENEETYNLLRDMDCDVAQGYWVSRPAPLEQILEWVEARQSDL